MFNRLTLFFALVLLGPISISIGVIPLDLAALLAGDEFQWLIVTESRLPRLISIVIAGASMSVCGLIMQHLSQNHFVSPTTAGLTDSARFGILMALIFFPMSAVWVQAAVAATFTFLGALLFTLILQNIKHRQGVFVPLVGIMFGNIIASITIFVALRVDLMQSIAAWLHGDFSLAIEGRYELLYVTLPALVVSYLYADRFLVVGMGQSFATNLGLSYQKLLLLGLVLVSLVTALVVITVGVIPFLGLIVPNIIRLALGDNIRKTLLNTALLGAVLVLICDILARLIIYPYEVSVSLIMGVFGSAIFVLMLLRSYRHGRV